MKYSQVIEIANAKGWKLDRLEGTFYGNRYELKHKNGGFHFAKNLSEVIQKMEKNETFPACTINSGIPMPVLFTRKNRTIQKLEN
jgi:hypothetical protein